MQEETGARTPNIVRAYLRTREIFDFESFWQGVEALDNKVPDAVQFGMLHDSERLMTRATLWFLRYKNLRDDIAKTVEHFAPGVRVVAAGLDKFLSCGEKAGLILEAERPSYNGDPAVLLLSPVSLGMR